ncbi:MULTISPECIES: radical SAM protein [Bacillota]|uniref:radical SAM protein n=1 Tax=Bacillota TaxID=1239 RepID=UPI000C1B59F4|nr:MULTISPECIES: radical SAM protein [Bacillota]MDU6824334.1 radical SAM protein [Intestinibacter bartlettii]
MCSAKWKYCCFSCSPESQQRLDINRVIQYIKESEEINEIKTIAFTGGEVFLEYPTLLKLVEISTEVGKNTSIATNGFWAVNEEATYDKLYQLKKGGLKHLSISHDRYHSEFISTNNIKNILKVSLNLDIQGDKYGNIKYKSNKKILWNSK